MKERPILFTPHNAQLVHESKKTQTRRILKSQPWEGLGRIDGPAFYAPTKVNKRTGEEYPGDDVFGVYDHTGEWGCVCPFGRPGTRLWIREAWAFPGEELHMYKGCPADAEIVEKWKQDKNAPQVKWKPSLHMPRWACRTVVELVEVRVERLDKITESDSQAEGVKSVAEFMDLWVSINKTWEPSLWVWVLTMRRVTP